MSNASKPVLRDRLDTLIKATFINLGILPFLLIGSIIYFGSQEARFLSELNMMNMARHSTFLIIIAMGQMVVLLTAGLDLSVGAVVGFSGVVTGIVLTSILGSDPDALTIAIPLAIAMGILAGMAIGVVNGIGVAILGVPPFMMTLGTMTSLVGVSLSFTSGLPITGIPDRYMELFGYGRIFGFVPAIWITLILFALTWILLNQTTIGRYFYSVGSNLRASQLSGINTTRQLVLAYVFSGGMAGITGVLFVARTGSAEALNGQSYALQSVAACVIAGVSLFGGTGKVRDVFLGAIFITMLTNGMNLIRVESYVQQIVLGVVLILALVVDQVRTKMLK